MQNCYNTNARSTGQQGAGSDIDERLTRRHLETLEFAQEIARQNRELKTVVQTLEQQLAAAVGADASGNRKQLMEEETQRRVKEMQELCNQRVDEVAKRLSEQHSLEVAALLQDRADAERSWYAARQQEQAELLKLQLALRDRDELAARLEAKVGQQAKALAAEAERTAALESAVATAIGERDSARRALAAAEERRRGEQAVQHELSAERQKCAELRLRLEQLARDREADSQAEAERQRQLDAGQRQLEELLARADQLEKRLAESERRLAEARRNESRLAAENSALESEIEALRTAARRQQQSSPASSQQQQQQQQQASAREAGDANFREFVAVKREVAALREENERLRGRLRTTASTGGKKARD